MIAYDKLLTYLREKKKKKDNRVDFSYSNIYSVRVIFWDCLLKQTLQTLAILFCLGKS